ncbi:hypothetical protein Vi05172_g8448 [Venturia inaequalis]|nr:hypothetical protein Vi05172_g8448 [Venturia inaequalis]
MPLGKKCSANGNTDVPKIAVHWDPSRFVPVVCF